MAPKKDETKWEECGFIIRRVNKGKPFQVDEGTRNGKRRRVRFETLGEARQHCKELKADLTNMGTAARGLSDRDRLDAAEARKELGKVAIMDAVRFYLSHHAANGDNMTIEALCKEYIEAGGRRGNTVIKRRPLSKVYVTRRLAPFQTAFGDLPVSGVTQSAVEKWIAANKWQGVNGKHYIATVKALFEYARRKKYAAINPAAGIEWTEEIEKAPPKILSPAQVQAMLRTAQNKYPELVPVLAVMFFAGLRPNEAARLDWGAVNIAGEAITIDAATAKMRRQRHITMPGNLRDWLMRYVKASGPMWDKCNSTYWRKMWALEKDSKVKLPYGAGRHAFASYHLALHGSIDATAKALGHAKADLLLSTYRNIHTTNGKPITKETAQEYFDIRPEGNAAIIPFPMEAAG